MSADLIKTIAMYALPTLVGFGIVFFLVFKFAGKGKRFAEPVEADAKVVAVRDQHVSRRVDALVEIELEVHPPDGSDHFPATFECYVPFVKFPQTGETVQVRYEQGNRKKIVLTNPSRGAV